MKNAAKVRKYVVSEINKQMDKAFGSEGMEHTFNVSTYAYMLSKKRNLDASLVLSASYLHDLARYISHYDDKHAIRSGALAKEILPTLTTYTQDEINQIVQAISNHSSKESVHDPLSECIKDADVLAHHLFDSCSKKELERLQNIKDIEF